MHSGRALITTSLHSAGIVGPAAVLDNIQHGYNDKWSCPQTPFENRLKVGVRAEEKVFEDEGHT